MNSTIEKKKVKKETDIERMQREIDEAWEDLLDTPCGTPEDDKAKNRYVQACRKLRLHRMREAGEL